MGKQEQAQLPILTATLRLRLPILPLMTMTLRFLTDHTRLYNPKRAVVEQPQPLHLAGGVQLPS